MKRNWQRWNDMLIAFLITWLFWLPLLSLLAYWRTTWYPLLILPILISVIQWSLALFSSSFSIWFSVILHAIFIIKLLWAFFTDKGPNDWRCPERRM
jgi:hypothetical protein